MTTQHCADCGVTLVFDKIVGHWGQRKGKGTEFYCHITKDSDDRIVAIDYHHIEGEEQRHFVAT